MLEKGLVGTLVSGLKKSKPAVSDSSNLATAKEATQIAKDIIKENHSKNSPQLTYEEQVDALSKMKTLLDAGVLTQEEFDAKKKQILGL